SPGYKLDVNCYLYSVNVTLKNNKTVHGRTSETCYSFTSPSFIILYVVIFLIFVMAAVLSQRKKLRKPAPSSKSVPRKSSISTKSLSTSMSMTEKSKKGKPSIRTTGKTKTGKGADMSTSSSEIKPITKSQDKAPKK
ncbi:hypothetical protein OSTOST_01963, partial [Ostertagia ostertagi]